MSRTYLCYRGMIFQLKNHPKYLETWLLQILLLVLWEFPSVSYFLVSLCCSACTGTGGSRCTTALQSIQLQTISSVFFDNFSERFAEFTLPFFPAGSLCTSYKLCRRKLRSRAVTFSNALSSKIAKACSVQDVLLQIIPLKWFLG